MAKEERRFPNAIAPGHTPRDAKTIGSLYASDENFGRDIYDLLDVMICLRDPERGCPWDIEQNMASVAPYGLEEAQEVIDAIAQGEPEAICDELGDLLLQVIFQTEIARQEGLFTFADVMRAVSRKMIHRHPHVFADAPRERWHENWHEAKAQERLGKE